MAGIVAGRSFAPLLPDPGAPAKETTRTLTGNRVQRNQRAGSGNHHGRKLETWRRRGKRSRLGGDMPGFLVDLPQVVRTKTCF